MSNNYFTTIEDEFAYLRRKSTILPPLDWELVGRWEEAKIPLRLILAEMRQALKKNSNINTLRYFEQAVWNRFNAWKSANTGASEQGSEEAEPVETKSNSEAQWYKNQQLKILDRLIELYSRPNLPPYFEFVQAELEAVDRTKNLTDIEEQLNIIGKNLEKKILEKLSVEEKQQIISKYSKSKKYSIDYDYSVQGYIIAFEVIRQNKLLPLTLYQL